MRFRDAIAGDEPAVQAIVDAVLREYGMALDLDGTDRDLVDLQSSYVARGGVFRVLIDDAGVISGCGGLYPDNADQAELRKMYLLPSARGQGSGLALLNALVDEARARGFTRIVLDTMEKMTRAIAFYEAHGFSRDDAQIRGARCSRGYVRDL